MSKTKTRVGPCKHCPPRFTASVGTNPGYKVKKDVHKPLQTNSAHAMWPSWCWRPFAMQHVKMPPRADHGRICCIEHCKFPACETNRLPNAGGFKLGVGIVPMKLAVHSPDTAGMCHRTVGKIVLMALEYQIDEDFRWDPRATLTSGFYWPT